QFCLQRRRHRRIAFAFLRLCPRDVNQADLEVGIGPQKPVPLIHPKAETVVRSPPRTLILIEHLKCTLEVFEIQWWLNDSSVLNRIKVRARYGITSNERSLPLGVFH